MGKMDNQNRIVQRHQLPRLLGKQWVQQRRKLAVTLARARGEGSMERDVYREAAKAAIRYLLLALTLIYLMSGLGITQYQIVEPLTLGLLTRNLAFRIHDFLLAPFVLLLLAHVLFGPVTRVYSHFKNGRNQQRS